MAAQPQGIMPRGSAPAQGRPAAADLIGTSLSRLQKLCGRDKKLAQVAAAANELQDQLGEVLSPGYAARAAAGGKQAASSPALAAVRGDGTPDPTDESATLAGLDDGASAATPRTPVAVADAAEPQQLSPGMDGGIVDAAAAAAAEEQRAAAHPGAISDAAALAVLQVLRLAVATAKPPLIEVSLDLLHKLIALRFLQGAAFSVATDREAVGDRGGAAAAAAAEGGSKGAAASDPLTQSPQAIAVELICRCGMLAVGGWGMGARV